MKLPRRQLFHLAAGAAALAVAPRSATAEQGPAAQIPSEPLVWPIVTKAPPEVPKFAGHANTVPDIVGRLGAPASLVIFTEGNHLMVLLGDDIVGVFPTWAKSRPQYADLNLDNVVVVTLPQPLLVRMIRTGGIALGNLTLDVSRKSGFYPDIVMGYPGPLRQLHELRVIESRVRFFSRNRGPALLVRKGNPLGIHSLTDVARTGARLALPEPSDLRTRYRAMIDELIGKPSADAFFAAEAPDFPGRLGIMHRDIPEMVARGYADVALTWYHLISYWTRIFPNRFALVPISGAERVFAAIAFGRVIDPLRPRALEAFDEFFFSRAKDVYPRYDFARMNDREYGTPMVLE